MRNVWFVFVQRSTDIRLGAVLSEEAVVACVTSLPNECWPERKQAKESPQRTRYRHWLSTAFEVSRRLNGAWRLSIEMAYTLTFSSHGEPRGTTFGSASAPSVYLTPPRPAHVSTMLPNRLRSACQGGDYGLTAQREIFSEVPIGCA